MEKTLLLLLLFSSLAIANSPFGPVKIAHVGVHDSNTLVVTIEDDGEREHQEKCDIGRKNTLTINKESPYEKEMFAVALAAKSAGKKISGWVNGCYEYWGRKVPKLTVIYVN